MALRNLERISRTTPVGNLPQRRPGMPASYVSGFRDVVEDGRDWQDSESSSRWPLLDRSEPYERTININDCSA